MRIRIVSMRAHDLPANYRAHEWYAADEDLTNFIVGEELDVYAVESSSIVHYYLRHGPECLYVAPFPAALTQVIDPSLPASWVVSHETRAQHRLLPEHQVIMCPPEWIDPFFSYFIDRLTDEDDESARRVFSATVARDYPPTKGT